MGAKHSRPTGAFADARELEYISALHQTGRSELRRDGSIHAIDVVHFLESRYGIVVTEEEVRERILGAFGQCARRGNISRGIADDSCEGGDSDENGIAGKEDCLDLTQVLAMLLVPLLLKAERSLTEERQRQRQTGSHSHLLTKLSDGDIAASERENATKTHADNIQPKATIRQLSPCFATHTHRERGGKRWPDGDLINNVLRTMLHDATGDPNPRPLTKELVRQLLDFYGEGDLADDERLVDDMLVAAQPADDALDLEGDPSLLDEHAFAQALTHDVRRYDIDSENSLTTHYSDVFQTCYSTKEMKKNRWLRRVMNPMGSVDVGGEGTDDARPVRRAFTLPSIDYTADTFRSKSFVILLWVTWILTYFSYLFGGDDLLSITRLDCDPTHFGCAVLQGITNWLTIMAQLSILGTSFVVWASIGNSVYPTNAVWIVVGMGATILFVLLPYFIEFEAEVVSTKKADGVLSQLLYHLSVAGGFVLLCAALLNLSQRLLPRSFFEKMRVAKFYTPGIVRREAEIKLASSCKMNELVRKACEVHKAAELDGGNVSGVGETKYGRAMLAYARQSDETEDFGGFIQTWKRIWSGELFVDDGIWMTTHMLAGNAAQLTICFLLGALFVAFYTSDLFKEGLKYLDQLEQVTGGSQRWRLMFPLFFGVIWGEMTILVLAANYIPSTVSTILRYRSGGIDSLHAKKFLKLRFAVDHSSLIFGSIFWGTLYTSVISGFFALLVLGILLWPDFAQVVIVLFANIIGISLTILVKWGVMFGFRRKYHRAYYRRSVALTNFVGVVLESWNLGLTTSYMILRSLKLLIAATLFIGRVDVPFLSQEVCFLGPIELDAYPLMYRKDILAHEAHRHPYLERLGVVYMMKLRHDDFGTYAGSCWRLLFVYALMPWMRKYRKNDDNISDFKFAANRMWTGRMPIQSASLDDPTVMASLRKSDASQKSDPDETSDVLQILKQKNELLRLENEYMRSILHSHRHNGDGEVISKSCPPKLFRQDDSTSQIIWYDAEDA